MVGRICFEYEYEEGRVGIGEDLLVAEIVEAEI